MLFPHGATDLIRDTLRYLFPLSLGHYVIALLHLQTELVSSVFPSTHSYVQICQHFRSGGVKGAHSHREGAAGLRSTQLPFTPRQFTFWGRDGQLSQLHRESEILSSQSCHPLPVPICTQLLLAHNDLLSTV